MPFTRRIPTTIAAVLFALAVSAGAHAQQDAASTEFKIVCGRDCLAGFANRFLDALVSHDPSRVPMAPDVRYTENGSRLAIGDALWATVGALGDNKLVFTDPEAGSIMIYAGLVESGLPSMFAARLKVENRQVTEIETTVLRRNEGDRSMQTFALDRPGWHQAVPRNQRVSRQALKDIADSYFEGITQGRGDITPFDENCVRFENGGQMTGRTDPNAGEIQRMGCHGQFETGMLVIVTSVSHRRYVLADEENQVVSAIVTFDHRGDIETVPMRTGGVFTVPSAYRRPFSFLIFETFKVVDGRIRQIEATVNRVPYRLDPGWPEE